MSKASDSPGQLPVGNDTEKQSELFADDGSGGNVKQDLIHGNRYVAAGPTVNDTPANDGRYATKHQDPQFSADIHTILPPPVAGSQPFRGDRFQSP